jgi:hypothetical protein
MDSTTTNRQVIAAGGSVRGPDSGVAVAIHDQRNHSSTWTKADYRGIARCHGRMNGVSMKGRHPERLLSVMECHFFTLPPMNTVSTAAAPP